MFVYIKLYFVAMLKYFDSMLDILNTFIYCSMIVAIELTNVYYGNHFVILRLLVWHFYNTPISPCDISVSSPWLVLHVIMFSRFFCISSFKCLKSLHVNKELLIFSFPSSFIFFGNKSRNRTAILWITFMIILLT